jgi:hypothetical protein
VDKFSYNIFVVGDDKMLAIADFSILDKTFEEGDCQIAVPRQFYHEKTCDKEEAKKLIRSATIINAVGKNIIDLMVKENAIDQKNILTVKGVPHAQVVSL